MSVFQILIVLGEVGQGWKVALVTLMNERLAGGGSPGPDWTEIMNYARQAGTISDQAFRENSPIGMSQRRVTNLPNSGHRLRFPEGKLRVRKTPLVRSSQQTTLQDICNSAIEMQDHYGIMTDSDTMPADGILPAELYVGPGLAYCGAVRMKF